jgi:predicted RNA-binding protein (virulence factor B family)
MGLIKRTSPAPIKKQIEDGDAPLHHHKVPSLKIDTGSDVQNGLQADLLLPSSTKTSFFSFWIQRFDSLSFLKILYD